MCTSRSPIQFDCIVMEINGGRARIATYRYKTYGTLFFDRGSSWNVSSGNGMWPKYPNLSWTSCLRMKATLVYKRQIISGECLHPSKGLAQEIGTGDRHLVNIQFIQCDRTGLDRPSKLYYNNSLQSACFVKQ